MLPPTIPLPCWTPPVPHFFVADNAFAMRHYIMKPCPFKEPPAPNHIFNYQSCRAHRIVENVSGITANRFRVLRKPLIQNPPSTVNIVLAVCVLHNFQMSTHGSRSFCQQPRLLDTENTDTHEVWVVHGEKGCHQKNVLQLQRWPYPNSQNHTRNKLREFFMTPQGEISWQYRCVWFHSYNTCIICQANCLLHHCDSIYRMLLIIKRLLFSSCTLNVCSFPINTRLSVWTVYLTYQIWRWFPWWQGGHHELQCTYVWPRTFVYIFNPTATFPFCHFLQFLRHLHRA
jgi:hypothetical protein